MRRIAALGSALVMVVGLLVTGVGSPANAEYQVKENVGIRMLDVNRIVPGCANYPVEYVVGNIASEVPWTLDLYLSKTPGWIEVGLIRLAGTGPQAGRKHFRLCADQLVGGRYVASAVYNECAVLEGGDVIECGGSIASNGPLRPTAAFDSEIVSITTLFKRTSDVRLWLLPGNPARGAPVAMRGNLRLEGVDGKLRFVGNRFVKIYGQKGPTSPFTYIATVKTDRYGAYTLALSHRRSGSYRAVYEGSPAYFPDSARTSPVFLD